MIGYIHENTLKLHKSASDKALALTVRFGLSDLHDRTEWFPMSQLTIGEPNECGWCKIEIPDWLIRSKSLQKAAFIEIEHN